MSKAYKVSGLLQISIRPRMAAIGRGCHPETIADIPTVSRKEGNVTNTTNSTNPPSGWKQLPPANLANLLAALESQSVLSESRRRDLRSAVNRVAQLLGNAPAAIPLAMDTSGTGFAASIRSPSG